MKHSNVIIEEDRSGFWLIGVEKGYPDSGSGLNELILSARTQTERVPLVENLLVEIFNPTSKYPIQI